MGVGVRVAYERCTLMRGQKRIVLVMVCTSVWCLPAYGRCPLSEVRRYYVKSFLCLRQTLWWTRQTDLSSISVAHALVVSAPWFSINVLVIVLGGRPWSILPWLGCYRMTLLPKFVFIKKKNLPSWPSIKHNKAKFRRHVQRNCS